MSYFSDDIDRPIIIRNFFLIESRSRYSTYVIFLLSIPKFVVTNTIIGVGFDVGIRAHFVISTFASW